MKNKILFILLLTGGFFFWFRETALATDPHLYLSPASGEKSTAFSVDIKIDTGGKAAGGADVHLEFPKDLLKINQVTETDQTSKKAFSKLYSAIDNDNGKLRINAYFSTSEAGESYNGTDGIIAKVDFGPKGTGTAEVKFTCSPGSTTESNIVDKVSVKDIIICSANGSGSYTLTSSGGGTNPTATPTQTGGGGSATVTPKPAVPVSGSVTQTIGLIGLGIISLLTGLALVF